MRRKLVVGNWKMNKTLPEALAMVEALINEVRSVADTEIAICPPFTAIDSVRHLARGTNVKVGAQDVFWAESGAFTGSISAGMLADLGCKFCIVGHSETRGRFGKLEIPESAIGYFAGCSRLPCVPSRPTRPPNRERRHRARHRGGAPRAPVRPPSAQR